MCSNRGFLSLGLSAIVVLLGCRVAETAPAAPAPALPTSAQAGGASIVAIAPPAQQCCPKQTLPQFLGITGAAKGLAKLFDRLRNRLGSRYPGLEAKPEVLAISDPKNLESDNPAVAAAAGVKAEEDAAAQKAKAIAYLASIGCAGCYPGIEDAILAALDDCTEEVRFGAAQALRSSATHPCKNCCRTACCGPKVRAKLEKLAYEMDEQGCYTELSDRVRRVARLAFANCNCVPEKPTKKATLPQEGPGPEEAILPPLEAVPAPAAAITSVLRSPHATNPAIGSAPVTAQVAAYQPKSPPAAPPMEVAWEEWTVRPVDFSSPDEAFAALSLARVQILSAQAGAYLPPQLARAEHGWSDPMAIRTPAVAQALATVPVGGMSGVIEGRDAWRVVRILGRRPAPQPTPLNFITGPAVGSPATFGAHASIGPPIAPAQPVSVHLTNIRLPDCNCK
jgi:hypothetical protein